MTRSPQIYYLFKLLIVLYIAERVTSSFEFTNLKCISLDKEFLDFEHCLLKSINRTYKYLSIKCNLFKTPLTKTGIHMELFKRYNGYKPFLINASVDACYFVKNVNSNPVFKYYYEMVKPYINVNTCPITTDIVIDKLPIDFVNHRLTKVLPFPEGDYMMETNWYAQDKEVAVIKVYGTLS